MNEILFHLQVSIPPYEIKGKMTLNLWNNKEFHEKNWGEISNSIHTKLLTKTVNNVFTLLNKVDSKHNVNFIK